MEKTVDRTKLWITAIICGTVLLLGFFIWPTPYRYDKVRSDSYYMIRTTRITGYSVVIKPEVPFRE